ncbi:Glycosyl transferases group 1, putative [Babesia ovata]|uniref:Glycosyl transferases group 1, putative n=1 Tax=Babesia ovata TaxID=189622 RepID=A0A2H6K6X3_9APIC|nr:Glycosyl transferases group 1, putative [Babesia ovata]GBE58735.1 Glycosyl transferases group 1, putative [Babesia ovata]
MTSARYRGRRNVAFVFWISITAITGVFATIPGDCDHSYSVSSQDKGFAFYADNPDCYRNVKLFPILSRHVEQIAKDLSVISSAIPESKYSPENKEAVEEECHQLMTYFESMKFDAKEYVELGKMFDERRAIIRELQKEDITPLRSAELDEAMANLEYKFEGKEPFASNILEFDIVGHYIIKIEEAEEFVRKHKIHTQPACKSVKRARSYASKGKRRAVSQVFEQPPWVIQERCRQS